MTGICHNRTSLVVYRNGCFLASLKSFVTDWKRFWISKALLALHMKNDKTQIKYIVKMVQLTVMLQTEQTQMIAYMLRVLLHIQFCSFFISKIQFLCWKNQLMFASSEVCERNIEFLLTGNSTSAILFNIIL